MQQHGISPLPLPGAPHIRGFRMCGIKSRSGGPGLALFETWGFHDRSPPLAREQFPRLRLPRGGAGRVAQVSRLSRPRSTMRHRRLPPVPSLAA